MRSGHGVSPLSLFAVLGLHTLQASSLSPSHVPSRFSYFDETFIQKHVVFCRNRCELLARGCLLLCSAEIIVSY